MGPCCVDGCSDIEEDTVYFEFPASRALRKKWLDVLKITNKLPIGSVVCSHHFNKESYENVRGKVRLKSKVVPSLRLTSKSAVESTLNTSTEKLTENSVLPEENKPENGDPPQPDSTTDNIGISDGIDNMERSDDDSPAGSIIEEAIRKPSKICKVKSARTSLEKIRRSENQALSLPDPKQPPDFEDMITNYQIKNSKPNALMRQEIEIEIPAMCDRDDAIVLDGEGDAPPVFIEINVDRDTNTTNEGTEDCLMVLESVQCDIDPTALMLPEQDLEEEQPVEVNLSQPDKSTDKDRVAKHPILTHSEDFRIFLTTADEELDKVFKSENSALNLWGLSSALYGSGEAKTSNGPRVKDPEFTSAADYLQSLQHKLTTLCTLTTKLHNNTISLGTELLGMKRACDAWATQARARTQRGAMSLAAGAHAAQRALALARPPLHARAVLPLLAQYAASHTDKIKQRDAIHAAYVSGTNTSDDLHNRLEQASEALRSELSDWIPKTHSEIKSILLDLADRQVNIHRQTLHGWEHSLKLATEANIEDIFKTVSKTAVQNLSPSRCRSEMSPTETEKDIDDYSDYNDNEEFEIHDDDQLKIGENSDNIASKVKNTDDVLKNIDTKSDVVKNSKFNNQDADVKVNSIDSKCDLENDSSKTNVSPPEESRTKTQEDILSDILEDSLPSSSEKKIAETKISDPLTDFTDIDLS